MYLTRAAYGIGFLALAAAAYAAWEGFRHRDAFIGFLILIVGVQISLSHGFLAGRSGFAFRYLAPAYPALCMLVGIGAYAIMRHFRLADLSLVGASAAVLFVAIVSFPGAYGNRPVGPLRQLRADLVKVPGNKVVFFDVGWDGERLQYETRRDPSISVMTDPGTGWATGGVLMTNDYVSRIIQDRAPRTSMFFYQYDSVWRRATFDSAFVPGMERLGCVRAYQRDVPTYTRANPDSLKGAVVVGYRCHVA
jgi:4-amino-4-deoxy-L-arabinose transferase-like glycosyltransferase